MIGHLRRARARATARGARSLIASAGYHLGIADSSIGLHGVLNRAVAFQALTQGAPWIIRCRLVERCVGTYLSLFCSCCSGSCLLSTPLFCGILLGGHTLALLARFPLANSRVPVTYRAVREVMFA